MGEGEKNSQLQKVGGHECDILSFLGAFRVDLEPAFAAKIPVHLPDFNTVLIMVNILIVDKDEKTKDLAVAHLQAIMEHCMAQGHHNLHDKVLALAFSKLPVMIRDMAGQRLHSSLLRRVDSVIEKTWDELGSKMMQVVLL